MRRAILAAILLATVASARAEPPPSSLGTTQNITLGGALAVLDAAQRQATALHAPSSLGVANAAGDLVAFLQMDGARPAGIHLAIGKARAAARFHQPTRDLENAINGNRAAMETAGAVAITGGMPLTVNGAVVGAVGVAGIDKDNDQRVAEAATAALR